jgi:exosortase A-associated hydrolase 1
LARSLASAGFATLRFDYRGLGDSDGALRGFEHVDDDLQSAIDHLLSSVATVERVVIWGLCDAATAAAYYVPRDTRVAGLVLLNPWVRSEQSLARSLLFHYYVERITNWRAWSKVLRDTTALRRALWSVVQVARAAFVNHSRDADVEQSVTKSATTPIPPSQPPIVPRIAKSLGDFRGPILLVLSGSDITANEFVEAERGDRRLRRRLGAASVTRHVLDVADHTFSRAEWRDRVAGWTIEWLAAISKKVKA